MNADFSFEGWIKEFISFVESRTGRRGFRGSCRVEPPLAEDEFERTVAKLPLPVPDDVRKFLLTGSGGCRFSYQWRFEEEDAGCLENFGSEDYRIFGKATLCVWKNFVRQARECRQWAEETWIAEYPEEKAVWLNCLPVAGLANGDYLAVRADGAGTGSAVYYLAHDDASQILAPSFPAFLDAWAKLGFIGPEIWVLEPFLDPGTGFLSGETAEAADLRRLLALGG